MNADRRSKYYRELWRNSAPIASLLPITFEGSDVRWESCTVTCSICDIDIPAELTRGTLTTVIPSVVTVETIAICPACRRLIPGQPIRFRSDGAVEWVQSGSWVRSYGRRITWWTRLVDRVKQLRPLWENLL